MDVERQQRLAFLRSLTGPARAANIHEQVVSMLPTAAPTYKEALEAGKFFCVIEKHDNTFDFAKPDVESFLWTCAKPKLPLRKVFGHYLARCPMGDDSIVIQLASDETIELDGSTDIRFSDLPSPQDGVLLLTAKRTGSLVSGMRPAPAAQAPSNGLGERSSAETAPTPTHGLPFPGLADRLVAQPQPAQEPGMNNDQQISPNARQPLRDVTNQHPMPSGKAATPLKFQHYSPPLQYPLAEQFPQSQLPGATLASHPSQNPDNAAPEEPHYQPREMENPFVKDEPEPELPARGGPLTQLTNEEIPERLEAAVQAGLKVLSSLESPLKDMPANEDTKAWLEQINKVREGAVKTRTVVGVVGNTGAGKSSVINAMLDEERLVPTNCMRACTAVVTELSYNYSENPATKYRAEIEFIKPEDWRKELKLLFDEIFDESGEISKEVYSAESDAGIAYAKVRAVYHKLTKDDLKRTSVDGLMRNKKVASLLGSSKTFSCREPRPFYDKLQLYVDSKEKGTQKLDKNGNVATN